MHSRTGSELFRTMILQWLIQLLCRPVFIHGLDRTMTMFTQNGLDTITMITTDSPRLTVSLGEWYVSDVFDTRWNTAADACDAMKIVDMIFRLTNLPPDEFSARRNGDYIWRDLWTEPSVCNRPVTGSHGFGSSHRLEQCCLWNAEAPLSRHLLPSIGRQTSQKGDTPFHCHLCQIHPRDAFKAFFHPCFRLILIFSYCLYDSLREQELGTGGSPIQSKREKWNVFAPDFQDTMELWALRLHMNWVKVTCVCELHIFFHQYVADLREGRSENIFRTVYISIREQELEIGGSHITDETDSFHGQIRLEKLDTLAPDSQDVRELWAVRPYAIFVMMMYTLESQRTFRGDLALCDLHEFLCLNVTDNTKGYPKKFLEQFLHQHFCWM